MQVSEFDYDLPQNLIAQNPIEPRDASRLLVLHKSNGKIAHEIFSSIAKYFNPGDVLVRNTTRVIPARLIGQKELTGAKIEVFLLTPLGDDIWEILARPAKRLPVGTKVIFGEEFTCIITEDLGEGSKYARFNYQGDFTKILDNYGRIPLPPYIKAELNNKERYQTVYANSRGSVAAPTAGLHFTPNLLAELKSKGVIIVDILLHVGLGTFRPVNTEVVEEHKMHKEYYSISEEAAATINKAKKEGRRVFAVGTTSVRTLETAASSGIVEAGEGWTNIFIYPGYSFKAIDCLITNFHLPKSTLLMLVSAFAGYDEVIAAYKEAVKLKYRFFSFGDAMLITNN